jgi:hypothetical protein
MTDGSVVAAKDAESVWAKCVLRISAGAPRAAEGSRPAKVFGDHSILLLRLTVTEASAQPNDDTVVLASYMEPGQVSADTPLPGTIDSASLRKHLIAVRDGLS